MHVEPGQCQYNLSCAMPLRRISGVEVTFYAVAGSQYRQGLHRIEKCYEVESCVWITSDEYGECNGKLWLVVSCNVLIRHWLGKTWSG
jgi:hypothetical protein